MTTVTLSEFRSHQSDYIAAAQKAPVELTSRGTHRRAVVVSPEFYDRALEAIENQLDVQDAAAARAERGRISHDDLLRDLGL